VGARQGPCPCRLQLHSGRHGNGGRCSGRRRHIHGGRAWRGEPDHAPRCLCAAGGGVPPPLAAAPVPGAALRCVAAATALVRSDLPRLATVLSASAARTYSTPSSTVVAPPRTALPPTRARQSGLDLRVSAEESQAPRRSGPFHFSPLLTGMFFFSPLGSRSGGVLICFSIWFGVLCILDAGCVCVDGPSVCGSGSMSLVLCFFSSVGQFVSSLFLTLILVADDFCS